MNTPYSSPCPIKCFSYFIGVLTPYSLLLTPHSLLLTPYSLLLTPHSLLLTPHSSLLTPHSSLLTDSGHVFHQYTIRTTRRNDLQSYLKEKGISTMIYYPYPLHKMKVFGNGNSKMYEDLTESEKAVNEVLSLPIEPLMDEQEIISVVEAIKEFFN